MKCPKCGTVYQDDVKFCVNCGRKLTYEVPEHTYYESSSNTWMWVVALITAVLIGGGIYWFSNMSKKKEDLRSALAIADSARVANEEGDTISEVQQQTVESDEQEAEEVYSNTESQLASKQVDATPVSNSEWWTGAIGGKYGIRMYINEETGEFWYHYTKYSSNNRMYLSAVENDGNHLVLLETNKDGLDTGTFDGYINGNTYSGTFYNHLTGKTFSFSLNR